MSVTIHIDYRGNLRCEASRPEVAHGVVTDVPQDGGGKGEYLSPTDLVAAALGSCVMTVLAIVTQRSNLDLSGAQVRVVKQMCHAPVRRIGALRVTVIIPPGLTISSPDRQRIERAARACPVKHSLHPDVDVSVEIVYPE